MGNQCHHFDHSRSVEARWAPTLDTWLGESYVIEPVTMDKEWRGLDRIAQTETGPVTLEYKCDTRAQQTGKLFFETVSNSVTGRPGWLYTCQAEWLVYFVV